MRAHDHKPQAKGRARSRARFRLNHDLGWLRGHPIAATDAGVRWLVVPPPGAKADPAEILVDRERLRKTVFRRNKLIRDFPRVLRELVGDVDDWRAAIDAVLDPLKATLHHGAPLPDAAARLAPRVPPPLLRRWASLRDRTPRLRNLLDAIAWWATDRHHAAKLIAAIESDAGRLGSLAADQTEVAMLVELLAADGPRAAGLLDLLCDRDFDLACDGQRLDQLGDSVEELQRRFAGLQRQKWPALPTRDGAVRTGIGTWFAAVYRLDAVERRRVYPLLTGLWPRDLGARWRIYFDRIAKVRSKAEIWLQAARIDAAGHQEQLDKRTRTLRRLAAAPPPITSVGFTEHVRGWIVRTATDRKLAADVARILRAIPVVHRGTLARLRLLCLWSRMLNEQGVEEGLVRRHLSRAARYFAHGDQMRALAPWNDAFGARESLEALPFDDPRDYAERREELWRLLAALRDDVSVPLDDQTLELVETLYYATDESAAATMRFLRPIVDAGRVAEAVDFDRCNAEALCAMTLDQPERLFDLAAVLAPLEIEWPTWDALAKVRIAGAPGFLADAILLGEHARVFEVVRHAHAGADHRRSRVELAWPGSGPTPAAGWSRRYPEDLRPLLRQLAGVDDQAEAVAQELLRRDFPDPARLRREIDGLKTRVAAAPPARAAHMRQRIATLQAALADAPSLSPRRLANYQRKLHRRVVRAVLDQLQTDLRARLRRRLRRFLSPDAARWCETDATAQRLLPHLLGLPAPTRALALRLLEARAGAAPWDLRVAPENERFLLAMRRLGVDLEPWLADTRQTVTAANGEPLVLQLEPDPLEIFRMGEHFATCLSPGDSNFFSTIANAVDVNKQVLYARDPGGKVRGRCLLALSDGGEILCFHPYAHESGLEFGKVVAAFCSRLARDMATTVAARGRVARLLSTDWYDDGVHSLVERGDWLDSPGILDDALPAASPASLGALIDQHAAGKVDGLILQRILTLLELRERADLVLVLEPWLLQQSDPLLLTSGSRLYRRAGLDGTGLLSRIPFERRTFRALDHRVLNRVLTEYVEFDPSRTLRVLRWTRAPAVKKWADECCAERVHAAGRAHEMMHRQRTALQIYEGAKTWIRRQKWCGERLRILRKVVGVRPPRGR